MTDIAFERSFDPRYGEAVAVAAGVRRVTAPNAGPFTFRGTNTFLIGDAELAILDPGPADAAHLDAVLRAVGAARVKAILVTHSHRDHSAGVSLLRARLGAPVLAAGASRVAPPSAEGARLDDGGDLGFAPDAALADGEVVTVAGHRIETVATPGHASDHLAFALPGSGALFTGDHVMGWATTVVAPPDGSMRQYMASLERLLARPERLYLPAHGGAVPDGPALARGLRSHRRMRERAIIEALRAGDRTVPEIVARIYAGLDAALTGAAALSTLAHLQDLTERGLVEADAAPALGARYGLPASAGAVAAPRPMAAGSG